jgi:tetratricopeptide (TPR) repeat protein
MLQHNNSNTPPPEDNHYGLSALSHMLRQRAHIEEDTGDVCKVEKLFLESIALTGNPSSMMELAMFYENNHYCDELIKKYYTMAIETDNCPISMFNFADFYRTRDDYENMVKYFQMAADNNDFESIVSLGIHYNKIGDDEKRNKYFDMVFSIEPFKFPDDYPMVCLNLVEIATLLNYADKQGISEENRVVRFFKLAYNRTNDKDIIVYKNKIMLFTRLQNVVECGICYDEKLNIDLSCGHCVCHECYLLLYKNPCPFCRIRV